MPFRSSGRGAYGPQGQRVLKGPLAPVWVTSGTLTGAVPGTAYSVQLTATDDSGDAPTYTLASGSLPTGLSLSSSGLISGTPSAAGTFTFTVNATDVNGRATQSTTLTIVAVNPSRAVDVIGAKGGEWTQDGGTEGGFGGRITANVNFSSANNPHYLLVGCVGGDDSGRGAAGGGGYSAIWYGSSNPASGTWIISAGGGGGEGAGDTGGYSVAGGPGGAATYTESTGIQGGPGGAGYAGAGNGDSGTSSGGGAGGGANGDNSGGGGGGGFGPNGGAGNGGGGINAGDPGASGGYGGGGGGGAGGGGGNPYRGDPGGGGGGGYVGGRGGSPAQYNSLGGGNFYRSTVCSSVNSQSGYQNGNGAITISGIGSWGCSGSVVSFNV